MFQNNEVIQEKVNISTILNKYSQEELMEHYLGVPLIINRAFSNPFRLDLNPSCSLYYKNNTLYFYDHVHYFSGNWLSVAALRYELITILDNAKLNSFIYQETLNLIYEELFENRVYVKPVNIPETYKEKEHIEIKVQPRNWMQYDKEYWNPIELHYLAQEHIFPIEYAVIYNKKVCINSKNNPTYGYRYGEKSWKIYSPLNPIKKDKWKQNIPKNQKDIIGKSNIKVGTTSRKDSILLHQYTGWECSNYQGEGYIPDETDIGLYIMDNDPAGYIAGRKFKDKFNIKIESTPKFKDPFEFAKKDMEGFKQWINYLKVWQQEAQLL